MKGLETVTPKLLIDWVSWAKPCSIQGTVIDRIPELACADPDWFAVYIHGQSGQAHSLGDSACRFPLMSVVKPFLLLYLLEQFDVETVRHWVGFKPSDAPFNSLQQLIADSGFPRNPMLNSGAIALANRLPGQDAGDRCLRLCNWLNQQAGCELALDEQMLTSVRSVGRETNRAIAHYLGKSGQLSAPNIALDIYEHICCLSGRVDDLAALGMLLVDEQRGISACHRRIVNAVMLTCGLYEASGEYAVRIGLPIKSGVSGALLAVIPNQGAIACYSPALDAIGNPVAGLAFLETVSQALQLSLFE